MYSGQGAAPPSIMGLTMAAMALACGAARAPGPVYAVGVVEEEDDADSDEAGDDDGQNLPLLHLLRRCPGQVGDFQFRHEVAGYGQVEQRKAAMSRMAMMPELPLMPALPMKTAETMIMKMVMPETVRSP